MVRIEIGSEADRLTIGQLLLKNGYTVQIGKEVKPGQKKANYLVLAWKGEEKAVKGAKTAENAVSTPATSSSAPIDDELEMEMKKLKDTLEGCRQIGF
ncbi:MAG: hypothetical protein J6S14_08260 [Clostridia bacterium]|nr:hypothetical protein [Clostridia bacterium]